MAKAAKHPGRPTKFKVEFCDKLIDFFDQEPYLDVPMPHYDKAKGKIVVWTDFKRMPNKLPTLRDFAKSIDISIRVIYNWLEEGSNVFHEEFLHAFTQCRDIRKWFIIQNGLQGLYNPLFAKFTAINVTDMRDTKEFEVGGKDGGPVEVTVIHFSKEKK